MSASGHKWAELSYKTFIYFDCITQNILKTVMKKAEPSIKVCLKHRIHVKTAIMWMEDRENADTFMYLTAINSYSVTTVTPKVT